MSILTSNGLQSAVYKGVDYTNTMAGRMLVLGKVRTHKFPSGTTQPMWLIVCQRCHNKHECAAWRVVSEEKQGCQRCYGEASRGANSPHWTGGKFVPGYFVAKVQTKLSRKSRLIDYTLTLDYLDALWKKQGGRCAYTNLELSFGNNVDECTVSLDRIDSSGDYAEGNVQFVHKTINQMKWDLTDMEFRNFCVLVARNLD